MATVLIVDDAAIVREPIAASLRMAGMETICASNGQEALRVIRLHRPDLVLLDLAMPNMDGATLLKTLREDEANADLPVIILTARSEPATVASVGKLRPNDCLFKANFSLPELIARIQKQLSAATAAN